MKQSKQKKPWSSTELLMAAALVLCLVAAGFMIMFFSNGLMEYNEAEEDYDALEEAYVHEAEVEEDLPLTEEDMEEQSDEGDEELLALMQSEQTAGATATPMPTPPPTAAPDLTPAPDDGPTATPSPTPTAPPTPTPPLVGSFVYEDVRYTVDFDSLKAINSDIVGWLLQDGTAINYPVVQAEDNNYYLDHLYTGIENKTGAIFLDCGNSPYFSNMVNFLYGHNRKDGKMFATLPKYQQQKYWKEHPSMLLLTPYEDYKLEIFACIRGSIEDKEGWHTKALPSKAAFDEFISGIEELSMIHTGVHPEWGDRIIALCTCTNQVREERYVVFARLSTIMYSTDETYSLDMRQLMEEPTDTRTITVPGIGDFEYYTQNDPLWENMRYDGEEGKGRKMGASGSAPCAMAMVITKYIGEENYWWLNYYSGREDGLIFCSCSVNEHFCKKKHSHYTLESGTEFRRFLPVALASAATGNNQWEEDYRTEYDGTSPVFFKRMSDTFGLYFNMSNIKYEAQQMLLRGGMVITVCGDKDSRFYGGKHYIVLVGMDEEYLYILDPITTKEYEKRPKEGIEQIEPGLLRVPVADWEQLGFTTYYMIKDWPY